MNTEPLLTKREVAELLRVTTRSIENFHRRGLRSIKLGRVRRYRPEDVREWLERHTEGE